jgi:hypothetical protein
MRWEWAASTTLYIAFRHAISGPSRDELTAGISLGGGILNALLRMARDMRRRPRTGAQAEAKLVIFGKNERESPSARR